MLVDRAAVAVDDGVDDCEKPFEDRVDFLGVEPGRQPHIADEIAEHNRDRAAFGGDLCGLLRGAAQGAPSGEPGAVPTNSKWRSRPRSLRRWPTIVTPRSFKSSAVRLAVRRSPSIALSRNAASYCPRPRFLSQARDVHGRLQSAGWDNHTRPAVCKASTSSGRGRTAGQCPSMADIVL